MVLCSITALSFGQAVSVNGGAIQGSITDASGAVVPNASVVIKATDTGSIREIKTDASGYYSVGPLNPGNYSLTFSAGGFQKLSVNTVVKTGTVTGVFFGVLAPSLSATGGRLLTLIVISAPFVPPLPSVMV